MPIDIIRGNDVVERHGYDEREVECPACGHRFLAQVPPGPADEAPDSPR